MHVTIVILRHILYLVYLCLCLGLGLFMLYLCALFFIFVVINYTTLFKQMFLFFVHSLEYLLLFLDDSVNAKGE